MSGTEANKTVVRACYDAGSRGDLDVLPELVTDDYVLHPDEIRGADRLCERVEGYRAALAGLTVTIEHQFTEADYVATRFTLRGRHEGELMGTPPTGREIEVSGLTISRCRDGKLAEEWQLIDELSLLRQVGALPQATPA